MKKIIKTFAIIVSSLVAVAFCTYLFFIRPIIAEESALKPVLLEAADQLMNCSFDGKEIELCYKQKTSRAFQKAMSFEQFVSLIKKIKEKLGRRLSSELIDEKFNLTVVKGSNSGKRVNFILKTPYQNDIFAAETYVYSLDLESNEYKLDSVMFNSNKVFE